LVRLQWHWGILSGGLCEEQGRPRTVYHNEKVANCCNFCVKKSCLLAKKTCVL
jgi:hypothetical protein